jgi:hypothetical protein
MAAACDVTFELSDQLNSAQQGHSYEQKRASLAQVISQASVFCHILNTHGVTSQKVA